MALIVLAAIVGLFAYPVLIPLYVALGFSVPAYLCAYLYMPVFRKINKNAFGDAPEEEEEEKEEAKEEPVAAAEAESEGALNPEQEALEAAEQ